MGKKKAEEDDEKGGKLKMIIGGVVGVAVLGVGAQMTVLKSEDAGAEAAAVAEVDEATKGGELIQVDAMSVNLADGHFLKIGVAIELAEGEDGKEFEKKGYPNKIRDLIITSAASKSMAELASSEGKEDFRAKLHDGAEKLYKESYHGIYFTEFVMQ